MKRLYTALLATLLGSALLTGCERPPMESTQTAYRGLAMGAVTNPRVVAPVLAAQTVPDVIPAVPAGGPLAKTVFKNVPVLGDLTVGEFTRTMQAITAWVAPQQGCAYCHKEGDDLSADTIYTKVVSRKMLQMTRELNGSKWVQHVKQTGVTCYTCHRGQPVPDNVWFANPGPKQAGGSAMYANGQNYASAQAGYTAMALDPMSPYLLGNTSLRAAGAEALPVGRLADGKSATIQATEGTFGMMMHISQSLGVNCTHCHNTRSHAQWDESPLQRTQAWWGINMTRELNNSIMVPLTDTFPAARRGKTGDVAKIGCGTCHQGVNKPLQGAPMFKEYPGLVPAGAAPAAVTAAAAEPAKAP